MNEPLKKSAHNITLPMQVKQTEPCSITHTTNVASAAVELLHWAILKLPAVGFKNCFAGRLNWATFHLCALSSCFCFLFL